MSVERLPDGRWKAVVSFATPEEAHAHYVAARRIQGDGSMTPVKKTPAHESWLSMLRRCRYPESNGYENYGGRGITVCPRWDPARGGSFESFYADMGERPEGRSLDRIDVNGNYEPENCRWATPAEQRANRRSNGKLTVQQVQEIRTSHLSNGAAGRLYGVDPSVVSRIRNRKAYASVP